MIPALATWQQSALLRLLQCSNPTPGALDDMRFFYDRCCSMCVESDLIESSGGRTPVAGPAGAVHRGLSVTRVSPNATAAASCSLSSILS